jgi:hypothetical protein
VTVYVQDAITRDPLAGAVVQIGAEEAAADEQGIAELHVTPGQHFKASVSAFGYLKANVFGYSLSTDFELRAMLNTRAALDGMYSLGGIAFDENDAVVAVNVFASLGPPPPAPLVGADVQVPNAEQSFAIVVGFPPVEAGVTTIPGNGIGTIIAANVPPGSTTVTVTPPAGETCVIVPGSVAAAPIDVEANAVNSLVQLCM